MNGFYEITDRLRQELQAAGFRVITLGDYLKVDLQRQNPLPYAHIVPVTSLLPGQTVTFTFVIVGLDLIDFNKDALRDEEDPYFGTDNMQDVLNDIHNRFNQVVAQFSDGGQWEELFRLEGEPAIEPFFHRYENLYAGWELTITIRMPNTDVNIC